MVFIQLLRKMIWWTKDEEKATIKNTSSGTVERYLCSTRCFFLLLSASKAGQLQLLWTAVAIGCSDNGFTAAFIFVPGPLCFLHPFFKDVKCFWSAWMEESSQEMKPSAAAALASRDCSEPEGWPCWGLLQSCPQPLSFQTVLKKSPGRIFLLWVSLGEQQQSRRMGAETASHHECIRQGLLLESPVTSSCNGVSPFKNAREL